MNLTFKYLLKKFKYFFPLPFVSRCFFLFFSLLFFLICCSFFVSSSSSTMTFFVLRRCLLPLCRSSPPSPFPSTANHPLPPSPPPVCLFLSVFFLLYLLFWSVFCFLLHLVLHLLLSDFLVFVLLMRFAIKERE